MSQSLEAPRFCETSRLSHFLDNWLTDGGEVVSLKRRLPFAPRKIPDTNFCQRLGRPQSHIAPGRIRPISKFSYVMENSYPRPSGL
jgi:hypothetical protein